MLRLLRHPVPYLVVCLVLGALRLHGGGAFTPVVTNDTASYATLMEAGSLYEALSGLRTYGYAAFLKACGLSPGDWAAVPFLHYLVFALALLLFWHALRRFTGSGWLALAAVLPLSLASGAVAVLAQVQPDTLGSALGLAAISLLLLLATRPRSVWLWAALGGAVFASYFTKPVYVFLVVLVPLLGAALRALWERRAARLARLTAGLAALTFVPLLLFCTLRWGVVGQFGVSNLGGYNLLGVAACFLDGEIVEDLEASDQRWVAGHILRWREKRQWTPMRMQSWIEPYQLQHTPNIFRIAEPVLTWQLERERRGSWPPDPEARPRDIPGVAGATALEMDRRAGELAREIIKRRPHLYLKWLHDGVRMGLTTPFDEGWSRLLAALLLAVVPLLLLRLARSPGLAAAAEQRLPALVGLWLVTSFFFLGQLGVVVLVHFLKERYAAAAIMLFPSLLAAGLFEAARLAFKRRADG